MSKIDQEAHLREKGYIPAQQVIDKVGMHHATLYRWIQKKKIKGIKVGLKHYVKLTSLIQFLGEEAAQEFGLHE